MVAFDDASKIGHARSKMTDAQIKEELERLSIVLSVDQRKKNPLVRRYIQKLRILLAKIREIQKEEQV